MSSEKALACSFHQTHAKQLADSVLVDNGVDHLASRRLPQVRSFVLEPEAKSTTTLSAKVCDTRRKTKHAARLPTLSAKVCDM